MIFNYAQQITVQFQHYQEQQQPTFSSSQAFLLGHIYDPKLKSVVDLVTYHLHDALDYLDALVTTNALAYFNSLAQSYMTIYVTYMVISVVASFIFGLVVFKKLKQQIMTSANILAIMPLEELDHKDKMRIEVFLNS